MMKCENSCLNSSGLDYLRNVKATFAIPPLEKENTYADQVESISTNIMEFPSPSSQGLAGMDRPIHREILVWF